MGTPVVSAAPSAVAAATQQHSRGLGRVLALVRYRFFLFAGVLPYLLGAAWAFGSFGFFDLKAFLAGLAGVACAVVGVEAFNEYFDSRMGTDRVFNPAELPPVADRVLWLGVLAFASALVIAVGLTVRAGWPVLVFALPGGAAAIFYEAPPVRWVYRGLGEAAIAVSYGPAMVLGSLYLQVRTLSAGALWASLVPGLLIMALAVANAIPDFHQDRLVGKRNLVVRLGRRGGVLLYLALGATAMVVAAIGVLLREFPSGCLATLLALPLLILSALRARTTYESARHFRPAIRALLACYVAAVTLFTLGIALSSPSSVP